MRIALIDSGLGALPTAVHLRRAQPDLDLLLALDPEGAPWGNRSTDWVIDRVLGTVRIALQWDAAVIVLPCNTASVTALEHVREFVGEQVPVIGTVPAIKPAAKAHTIVAVWATTATTHSAYQADLIQQFSNGATVYPVACPGLAQAIDRGDREAAEEAVAIAADHTPDGTEAVVLGCTHYPLVQDMIAQRLGANVTLFDSAQAVANQTLRRIATLSALPLHASSSHTISFPHTPLSLHSKIRDAQSIESVVTSHQIAAPPVGNIDVLLSGREASLPKAALQFSVGRELQC